MSLSKEDRWINVGAALGCIWVLLGKRTLREFSFTREDPIFKGQILSTTWEELRDLNYIARTTAKDILSRGADFSGYRLTPLGWITHMYFLDCAQLIKLNDDLGVLSKALKAKVKPRAEPAYASVSGIASETGLDEAFIINAIDAFLMDLRFNQHGARWRHGEETKTIEIPITFGLDPLLPISDSKSESVYKRARIERRLRE
jgi:hypothetical protein